MRCSPYHLNLCCVLIRLSQVAKVLRSGGMWLYITWRQPHFIKPLLERSGVWSVESEVLADGGGMFEYYGYVMRKTQ